MILVIGTIYLVFVIISCCGLFTVAYPILDDILYNLFHLQNFIPVDSPLVPFLDIMLEFVFTLLQTAGSVGYFVASVFVELCGYAIVALIKVLPFVLKVLKILISFCMWLLGQIWRGISVRDNQIWSILSWTLLFCSFVLYQNKFIRGHPTQEEVAPRRNNGYHGNQWHNMQHALDTNINRDDQNTNLRNTSTREENNVNTTNQNEENVERENNSFDSRHDSVGDNLCIVCLENEKRIAVFPCGHLQFCQECVQTIMQGRKLCPVCLGRIQDYRRVYI